MDNQRTIPVFLSIVIPAYNSAQTLEECLRAIERIDGYEHCETIVVDDASTDSTLGIAKKFGVKIVSALGRRGAAFARNSGAKAATGEYLLFIDSDVALSSKNILSCIRENFNSGDICGFAGVYDKKVVFENFFSAYKHLYMCFNADISPKSKNMVSSAILVVRRNSFLDSGGFDEEFTEASGEDIEFTLRFAARQKKFFLMEPRIAGTHFKKYNFATLLATDYLRLQGFLKALQKVDYRKMHLETSNASFRTTPLLLALSLGCFVLSLFWPFFLFCSFSAIFLFMLTQIRYFKYLKKHRNGFFALFAVLFSFFEMLFAMGCALYLKLEHGLKKLTLLKFLKYTLRFFYKKGLPLNLIFFVTSKCNAKCRHCFFWKQINSNTDEMDLQAVEKVAKSVPGLLALSLTGGEPFLRSGLADIASVFSRFTSVANIQIPTNGLLTDTIFSVTREILKRCREDIRIVVGVSVDGFADMHDDIRQVKGCFQKAAETIRRLKSLEGEFLNFRAGCIVTISKANQEKAAALVDYLKNQFSVEEVTVNIIRSQVRDMSLKELDIRYYDDIFLRLRNSFLARQKKPSWLEKILSSRHYYGSRLLSEIHSRNKYVTPCYAGDLLAVMREDGRVYPCEMLDEKMGDLKDFDFDFKKLWFSRQAREVREKIKKQKCFCVYECAMTLNTLFNCRHFFVILNRALRGKKVKKGWAGSPFFVSRILSKTR